jgi:hypothetical protein
MKPLLPSPCSQSSGSATYAASGALDAQSRSGQDTRRESDYSLVHVFRLLPVYCLPDGTRSGKHSAGFSRESCVEPFRTFPSGNSGCCPGVTFRAARSEPGFAGSVSRRQRLRDRRAGPDLIDPTKICKRNCFGARPSGSRLPSFGAPCIVYSTGKCTEGESKGSSHETPHRRGGCRFHALS